MYSIEQLSNEIFLEIFGYLDGYDIYNSFSNLNSRFENVLKDPSLLFKFKYSFKTLQNFNNDYKEFLYANKHHITSLCFLDEMSLYSFINLYFNRIIFERLQSIRIDEISSFKLAILLCYLQCLPYLSSFTVSINEIRDELEDIYMVVFKLKVLKYLKINVLDYAYVKLNMLNLTNIQYALKHLVIIHRITLYELIGLLSFVPKVTHLFCSNVIEFEYANDDLPLPIALNNLIHLTITTSYLVFDYFEKYLIRFFSQLRILTITISDGIDRNYLDPNRWEYLIIKHIPYLNKFMLCYIDVIDNDSQVTPAHSFIKNFFNLFWINNHWIFRIVMENEKISYLIRPNKKSIYDFQEFENRIDSIALCGVHMVIINGPYTSADKLINKINSISKSVDINRLVIDCHYMSMQTFITVLVALKHLEMLKVLHLPPIPKLFLFEGNQMIKTFREQNKIKYLFLKDLIDSQEINPILDLFVFLQKLILEITCNIIIKYDDDDDDDDDDNIEDNDSVKDNSLIDRIIFNVVGKLKNNNSSIKVKKDGRLIYFYIQ